MSDQKGDKVEVLKISMPKGVDRVETGPVKFGDDWAGYFIRGDNAFALSMALERAVDALNEKGDAINAAMLGGFADNLTSCIEK